MRLRNGLIAASVFPCCLPLAGQVSFLRKDVVVGDRPSSAVVGDFNGDGRPDLVVNSFSGLSVLLNTGGGSFARPITIPGEIHPMFGPTPSFYTVAADFNRDGRLDLAGTVEPRNIPEPRTGYLLLGRGDGTFEPREIGPGTVLATGDFNGDRIPDLVMQEQEVPQPGAPTPAALIMLGNGEGYFQRSARIERVGFAVRVADFNRDGFSDLAATPLPDALSIWLSRGDGTFGPPVVTTEAGLGVVGDFNRDGVPDMATGTEVLLGNGDGTFRPVRYIPSRRGFPNPFAAADFDGDGQTDLAGWLSNEGGDGNHVTIFRGKGDGTLSLPIDYTVGTQAFGQTAADLDGDGRPELITTNFRSNGLTLLMPRAAGPQLNRAVSAAGGTAIVAPESLARLEVATGATITERAEAPYPTRLGGISLEVRDSAGATRLAPLLLVSPSRIDFQVPAGTSLGEATLSVAGRSGPAGSMQVDAVAPGLFMVSDVNSTPAARAVRVAPDGTQTPVPVYNCFGPAELPFSCGPAGIRLAGDPIYLTFFATGFRGANSRNVTVSLYGIQLPVEYAGPQGTPGVDQINVLLAIPADAPRGPAFVTVAIDGVVANTALLQIIR